MEIKFKNKTAYGAAYTAFSGNNCMFNYYKDDLVMRFFYELPFKDALQMLKNYVADSEYVITETTNRLDPLLNGYA